MYNIVFLGPPGSGKGTQSDMLCEELNIPHISTGDIFREILKRENSELADTLRSYMNSGQLVPDEIVVKIVLDRLGQDDCKKGYLLDGFPRSLNQAKILDENVDITDVILIEVGEDLLMKRLTGRRIAKNSGRIYNIYFNPPKVEGKDDETGEDLYQREDDTEATVTKRLQVYRDQTLPSVEYYEKQGKLHRINGEQDIDVVYKQIREVVLS